MAHVLSGRAETPTQSRILTYVRDEGPLSRMDLASRLNVSRTTVAAEVGRLVELGLAEDGGPAASRGGRRSTLVDLDAGLRFVGIELGATSMRIAMTDGRLGVIARESAPKADIRRGPEAVLGEAIELVRKLLADHGVERPAGIGIGVPGPVDFQSGVPVSPPIMPGWDGYPVRDALSREFGAPVLLDNDVNVMALGEQHNGVARSASDFLFVKIGTGIGCGIVVAAPPLPRRRRLRRRHRAHPARPERAGLRVRQPRLPRGVLRRSRAGPRRHGGGPVGSLRRPRRSCSRSTASSPPSTSAWPSPRVTPSRSSSPATAAGGSGRCWPTWCRSSTPA